MDVYLLHGLDVVHDPYIIAIYYAYTQPVSWRTIKTQNMSIENIHNTTSESNANIC
jgi:hypothetical protein